MNYYTSIIFLCCFALVILSVLVWENNRLTKKQKSLFYITYAIVALASLMEWTGLRFSGDMSIPIWMLRTVKCADYILTPIAGAALIINIKNDSIWKKIIKIVLIINTVFQIVSAFTGWMLNVDEKHYYSHGPLYPCYMVIYSIVIVIIAIEFITYGKKFPKHNKLSLYGILSLAFICIMIQEILGSEYRTAYFGLTLGMIMMFIHISEFSQLRTDEKIEQQKVAINTDSLTGVSNRYAYDEALNRFDSEESLPDNFVIFSVDINGLKTVNDILGHAAGDELIRGAADCIRNTFEPNGVCFRTGGDEFIVFSEMDKKHAQKTISELLQNAAKWRGEKVGELHLAAGFACASDYPELTGEKLVIEADTAMYKDKAVYYHNNNIAYRLHNS